MTEELEDVLALHQWEMKSLGSRVVLACVCGDLLIPEYSSGVANFGDFHYHLANEIRKWIVRQRDDVARQLELMHVIGNSCGTTGNNACSMCFGGQDPTSTEVAESATLALAKGLYRR